MGISVKSRSRNTGKEKTHLNIPNDNFEKVDKACKAFSCVPYFAILVDRGDTITIFILSKSKLLDLFPSGKTNSIWKMGDSYFEKYKKDKKIIMIEFKHDTLNWWTKK